MSYFIFKDIHSDEYIRVEGIPPVIKPPKRFNLKEIDGSSITRIEEMGYKAYTKPIKIWFKDSDILMTLPRVMSWLDGAGRLILSNEPDKYYDAYILEQIDYEKAIRYRMATVNFFVQPYKYALWEEETASRSVINQGNVASLPLITITGMGMVNLLINGRQICTLTINGHMTLDSDEKEAHKNGVLQNRLMIGDFPELSPGVNEISFTGSGSVTAVKTLVRSRWL